MSDFSLCVFLRSDMSIGQRPLNSIHFFTNHPDRLLIAPIWHGFDSFYCVTNLVVAIPNQVDSRVGFQRSYLGRRTAAPFLAMD